MSRESKIKAVAGALQAKSLDLTQYAKARAASRERTRPKMRTDDAAYALGFATLNDPLATSLLRLKYAKQRTGQQFNQALLLLLHRHGWHAGRKPSETMYCVATAALFEWLCDVCVKCREQREGAAQPRLCLDCGQERVEIDLFGGKKKMVVVGQPSSGCRNCLGLGRVFPKLRKSKGVRCIACRSSGRTQFKRKQRWQFVDEMLVDAQKSRGMRHPAGMPMRRFMDHWLDRYLCYLDVLRRVDYHIVGEGIDFGFTRAENRASTPLQEKDSVACEEPDDAPLPEPTGELPPKVPEES